MKFCNSLKVILFLFLISLVSCGYQGLKRTSLNKWKTQKFPSLGIQMDLPIEEKNKWEKIYDSKDYQENAKAKAFEFLFHPIYHGPVREPLYLGECRIVILSNQNYVLFENEEHIYATDFSAFKNTKFFPEITEYEITHPNGKIPLRCFRKDIKSNNTGNVILASITYMEGIEKNVQYQDEDIKAIKRILNSIKFLDEKK